MSTGEDRPVVHDRRRIDPATGAVRPPDDQAGVPGKAAQAAVAGVAKARAAREDGKGAKTRTDKTEKTEKTDRAVRKAARAASKEHDTANERVNELAKTVAERTADLQRLTAEYANYRKRVDRDREAVKEQSKAEVLGAFLDVLDDIGRARDHGELEAGDAGESGEGPKASGFRSVAEAIERTVSKFGLERYGEVGDPFDPTVHEALLHSYAADVSEPTCATILQPGYRVGDRILRAARVAVTEPEPYDPSGGQTSD